METLDHMTQHALNPEHLAYWYFRLNGFLTTVNFVVHPEEGAEQRTDVDILGVRFPYRAELLQNVMPDESIFTEETRRPYIVIAEVKRDRCYLNGPWTRPQDENLRRVITAIGAVPPSAQEEASICLYKHGVYSGTSVFLTLCCLGRVGNPHFKKVYPRVPQILWAQVASFIYSRFERYLQQKLAHRQWDATGHALYNLARKTSSPKEFIEIVCEQVAAFDRRL